MENYFVTEAQAAREEEEETARRRRVMLIPFSRDTGPSSPSAGSLSAAACPASTLSSSPHGEGVPETARQTAAASAAAGAASGAAAAAAASREEGGAGASGGSSAASAADAEAVDVDPLDAYMSGITEQVKQQDEELRLRQQCEAEEIAAAAAVEAATAGGTATNGQQQHTRLLRTPQELSSTTAAAATAGNAASFGSSSSHTYSSSSQRIFADDDDPLADSFEHVLMERKKTAEAQAARAAQAARKRKADREIYSDDEGEGEKLKSKNLPPVDHTKWIYPPFVKDIYKEFKDIEELTHAAVGELKRSLQLRTFGKNVPRPIASFLHLKDTFSAALFTGMHKRGFSLPTPIQSAAIPCLLRGRDLLAVAETGSGKTAAYLIPLLARLQHLQEEQQWQRQEVHPAPEEAQCAAASSDAGCTDSSSKAPTGGGGGRGLLPHGGPAALVVCPTRELAVQLDGEVHALVSKSKKGAAALLLRRVLLAGGFDKTEQFKQLKQGVDLAICTPGRVIDTAATKGMQNFFQKVVAVVVDEADKMVDMGFEASLRNILNSIRQDRLTAMFSATFSPACENLARQFLDNPIKIIVGEQGQAAKSVEQNVVIVADEKKKFRWLADNILSLLARPPPRGTTAEAAASGGEEEQQQGRVAVIFCNTQQRCEDLAHLLEEELSQHMQRQQEQQQQQAPQGDERAAAAPPPADRDAACAAATAPSTRAAAARLLQLETDENPSALKKNPHQTFKYSTVVHGGLNLTERLAAIRRLHQHILHPPSESSSSSTSSNSSSSASRHAGAGAPPLLLIATDVASRGLDFPGALALVISYDAPQEAEVYVHRIGRAGRAGRSGRSYALLTRAEKRAAAFIVESMRTVDQEPPRHVVDLAMLYPPFKTATLAGVKMQEPKRQGGKRGGRFPENGLAGLGYSRDEAGNCSSSERRGGKSVASLVARAAAAAAESLKQQQQHAAGGGDSSGAAGAEGAASHAEEGRGGVAGAWGESGGGAAVATDNNSQKRQRQQGGPKRGRWDSDEKKGSAAAGGNTFSGWRPPGSSSSLLHSTDSTGISSSSTSATGKVVGIHDELSSDEDEGSSSTLFPQHPNPLQQQHFVHWQQQQQHYLSQQQQQHYVPAQPAFQPPVHQQTEHTQQQVDHQQLRQQLYYQDTYYQQQYQQPPSQQQLQQQEDPQHQHKAEVDAAVQQAAAAAAAAARAAAAQVVAAKGASYPAYGSSSCPTGLATRTQAPPVSAAGELPYCVGAAGAADPSAVAVAAGAAGGSSCSTFETGAASFVGGAASSLIAAGPVGLSCPADSSATGSAALPKRPSVLNLEKREQRRKQWLVHAEARREQLRLQNQRTEAAQKQQQQRYPSPVRKSFSERPHSVPAAARAAAAAAMSGGGGGDTATAPESTSAANTGHPQGA